MKKLRESSIIVLPLLAILILFFSITGYLISSPDGKYSIWAILFSSIEMFTMGSDTPENVHWMLYISKFLGVIFIGFTFILVMLNFAKNVYNRLIIKVSYKNHTVIAGLGSKGFLLAKVLLDAGEKVIVVEQNKHNENIPEIEELNGIVLIGDALDQKIQRWLKLNKARRVIFVLNTDIKNIESVNLITRNYAAKKRSYDLTGIIHIQDEDNLLILKDYLGVYQNHNNLEIIEFNINHFASKTIYDQYPPHQFVDLPLLGKKTNIAIIGYNKVAETFIIENLILSHYEDLININIWLFHQYAVTIVKNFEYKYPFAKDYIKLLPVSLNDSRFSKFDLPSEAFLPEAGFNVSYVFEDEDATTINSAKRFRQFLYTKYNDLVKNPIIACLPDQTRITDLINLRFIDKGSELDFDKTLKKNLNITIFRIFRDTLTKENLIDKIELNEKLAQVINYFYSILWEFQYMANMQPEEEIINGVKIIKKPEEILQELFLSINLEGGEPLQILEEKMIEHLSTFDTEIAKSFTISNRWKTLTAIKKNSNRYAARHLEIKLKIIGHYQEITNKIIAQLAPLEHKRWCAEELVMNYRKGELKENKNVLKNELKIHNLIVPFEELDEANVLKDEGLFLLITQLEQIRDYCQKV